VLVIVAATRLLRQNVDVLMDRVPADAQARAQAAIGEVGEVSVRRLRMREAGGRHFADVVIGVPPGAAVAQGHALADAVEAAVERALPGSDVVVHVEPDDGTGAVREVALGAALAVPSVREVHNVTVLQVGDQTEVSLHLKLPGDLPLEHAHAVATAVETAIRTAAPDVAGVQTHLEPLAELSHGSALAGERASDARGVVARIVREAVGREPRGLRLVTTDEGVVAFLTLALEPGSSLADAHARASRVEERIRAERPDFADVIVHTEP
jgi:divalent metal cation (Fe/Co/Zn/Cd) transporter